MSDEETKDLHQIASFHRVVKNYVKMKKIEAMTLTEQLPELSREEVEAAEREARDFARAAHGMDAEDPHDVFHIDWAASRNDFLTGYILARRRAKAERDFLKFQIADLKERHGDKAPF